MMNVIQHGASVLAVVAGALSLHGCASDSKSAPPPAPPPPPASVAANTPDVQTEDPAVATLRLLDEKLNSARLAATKVATMPTVRDARARQEILLHAALYRAAHESRVSRNTSSFVLDPIRERNPPDIGMDSEEFRLRVLGALDDLNAPVAWVTETWRSQGVDRFPGTGDVATRLRITIFVRDENRGVVTGEVGDWTAGGGASKQAVTAQWDGLTWQIDRGPMRMEW